MQQQTNPLLSRATIVHILPGRVRLQISAHRGDRAFFARVAERLSDAPGIRAVRVNPTTGSVLVLHAPQGVEQIAHLAREHGLFDLDASPPETTPAHAAGTARRRRPAPVQPLMLAAAGLAGCGAIQTARGRFHGTAAESLWNAYTVYAVQRQPAIAAGLLGLGLYQLLTARILGSGASLFLYAFTARSLARGKSVGGAG